MLDACLVFFQKPKQAKDVKDDEMEEKNIRNY